LLSRTAPVDWSLSKTADLQQQGYHSGIQLNLLDSLTSFSLQGFELN